MASLDKNGNVFEVDGNPEKEKVMEMLGLKDIPLEEKSRVINMTDKERMKYYREA